MAVVFGGFGSLRFVCAGDVMSNKKYRPDPSGGNGKGNSNGNGKPTGNEKAGDSGASSPLFGEEMQARLEAAFGKAPFDQAPLDDARGGHGRDSGDGFDVSRATRQGDRAHAKASEAGKVISDAAEAELRARQRVPLSMADARRRAPGELDGWLATLSDEDLEKWMEIGRGLMEKLETRVPGVAAGSGPLTDEEARGYLANGVRLLNQVTTLTSMVLDTIDVSTLRKIAARDSRPMSVRKALKTLGYDADRVLGAAVPPDRLGRGCRHVEERFSQAASRAAAPVDGADCAGCFVCSVDETNSRGHESGVVQAAERAGRRRVELVRSWWLIACSTPDLCAGELVFKGVWLRSEAEVPDPFKRE